MLIEIKKWDHSHLQTWVQTSSQITWVDILSIDFPTAIASAHEPAGTMDASVGSTDRGPGVLVQLNKRITYLATRSSVKFRYNNLRAAIRLQVISPLLLMKGGLAEHNPVIFLNQFKELTFIGGELRKRC